MITAAPFYWKPLLKKTAIYIMIEAIDLGEKGRRYSVAEKDMAEKTLEAYEDVFADIVNVLLFHGKQFVKEEELEDAVARSTYKADGKLREQERDTAKYWKKQLVRIALIGLENQTEPDNDMPLRVYGYDGAAYRGQLYKEKGTDGKWRSNRNQRYPSVTLVLYFGTKRWDKARTLYEALGDGLAEELKPYVPDMQMNLFEIAFLSDEQLKLFQSDFGIVADYFVQIRKDKKYVQSQTQMKHVHEVLQLMSVLTGDTLFEDIVNEAEEGREAKSMEEWLHEWIHNEIRKELKKGYQDGEKAGYRDGEKAGFRNGEKARARETARRLKEGGMVTGDIAYSVGESVETVEKWLSVEPAMA